MEVIVLLPAGIDLPLTKQNADMLRDRQKTTFQHLVGAVVKENKISLKW